MNNYDFIQQRERGKHLLVVEGHHEKYELLSLILGSFPEINIHEENVIIYGTNIYQLHAFLVKEYDEEWYDADVDIPYVISKMKQLETAWHKDDFIDIFMIFDFERQDPFYSGDTIKKLQEYFGDSTDVGKLYINYPMVESYWDTYDLPNDSFACRRVMLPLEKGEEYKNKVKYSPIANASEFPQFLNDVLDKEYGINDETIRKDCIEQILKLHSSEHLRDDIERILFDKMETTRLQTAKYFLESKIIKVGYTEEQSTYFEFMRKMLSDIICKNIKKANYIQGNEYEIAPEKLKEIFYNLDYVKILDEQNTCSQDSENGFIWVLNSSVFFVPDYKFDLIEK